MIIKPNPNPVPFGIYKNTNKTNRPFGTLITDNGIINKKDIKIYNAYSRSGKLMHRLFYLSDLVGNFLKFKLDYFNQAGQKYKTVRGSSWTI